MRVVLTVLERLTRSGIDVVLQLAERRGLPHHPTCLLTRAAGMLAGSMHVVKATTKSACTVTCQCPVKCKYKPRIKGRVYA